MNFLFTNNHTVSRIDEIVDYLMGPRLWIPKTDYPDFLDWTDKVYFELKKDLKRAIIAVSSNDIVGVAIYQRHKKDGDALEIKNLTVRPDQRGRYIASFLMRNAEIEGGKEFQSHYAVCDAKESNLAIRNFLFKNKYLPIGKTDLYGLSSGRDIVYKKPLLASISGI